MDNYRVQRRAAKMISRTLRDITPPADRDALIEVLRLEPNGDFVFEGEHLHVEVIEDMPAVRGRAGQGVVQCHVDPYDLASWLGH